MLITGDANRFRFTRFCSGILAGRSFEKPLIVPSSTLSSNASLPLPIIHRFVLTALFLGLLLPNLLNAQTSVYGQNLFIKGATYRERCDVYISQTVKNTFNAKKISSVRAGFVYIAARLLRNQDVAYALAKLDTLVQRAALKDEQQSLQLFTLYQLMHTYALCKHQIPAKLRADIKAFMQSYSYEFPWGGTLNLTIMPHAAAYIAAEEWPDFVDAKGRNATQVIAYSGKLLSNYMSDFFKEGCYEVDSPIYYTTNIAPTRLLSDFVKAPDLQRRARSAYHAMLMGMLGAYNKGLYVATPARSKGWDQLGDGLNKATSLTVVNWFFHGTANEALYYDVGGSNETFNFWLAYPGYTQPLPEMFSSAAAKTFPYERKGYQRKYTYQSTNYGLATWDIHTKRADHFMESKCNFLSWQSDQTVCHFTVHQDNESTDSGVGNSAGMGENPYSRIRQYKSTALAVWNVPDSYPFYRIVGLYHKSAIKSILRLKSSSDWVLCHTGTMMFAFKTPHTYTWNASGANEPPSYQGVQRIFQRKGYWILETTEVIPEFTDPNRNLSNELGKFAAALNTKTRVDTLNYNTSYPRVQYTSLNGDVLDLTFYLFNETYTNQFKVNGAVVPNSNQVFADPFMSLQYNSTQLNILRNGTEVLRKVNFAEAPVSKVIITPQANNTLMLSTDVPSNFYHWILPEGASFVANTNAYSPQPIVQLPPFQGNVTQQTIAAFVADGRIAQTIYADFHLANRGLIRFNTNRFVFEGYDGSAWQELNPLFPLLDRLASKPTNAYSLRKLRQAYTGSCLRVRRDDGRELNIGFLSSGLIDTVALLSFASGQSLFVKTWYDQSARASHLTQNTLASQPRIVYLGKIDRANGSICINALGTATMSASNPRIPYDSCFVSLVKSNNVTTNTGGSLFLGTGSGYRFYCQTGQTVLWFVGAASLSISNVIGINKLAVYSFWTNAQDSTMSLAQNTLLSTEPRTPNGRFSDRFVAFTNGSTSDNGMTAELIVFPYPLSDQERTIIEQNQLTYWKIN